MLVFPGYNSIKLVADIVRRRSEQIHFHKYFLKRLVSMVIISLTKLNIQYNRNKSVSQIFPAECISRYNKKRKFSEMSDV